MNLNMKFKDGKSKALTLSYDDGSVFDKRLISILNKHGLKATFNLNICKYASGDSIELSEARKLYIDSGHEVAAHTLTHPIIHQLRRNDILNEILQNKQNLETEFDCLVRGMAYPFGSYSDEVISILKTAGIVYARSTDSTHCFNLPKDSFLWEPTCHHNDVSLKNLAEKFVNEQPRWGGEAWLFYVWGHSHEFNNNGNWNIIEEFAEYTGNKKDIWYATNIEIYDYIEAYHRLVTNTDNTIIYNPSAVSVWVSFGENIYEIMSGETLKINN